MRPDPGILYIEDGMECKIYQRFLCLFASLTLLLCVLRENGFTQRLERKTLQANKQRIRTVSPWPQWRKTISKSISDAAGVWVLQARIKNGRIMGAALTVSTGSFLAPSLYSRLYLGLKSGKMPENIAKTIAKTISSEWRKWQHDLQVSEIKLFPKFENYCGPTAPPTKGIPIPLSRICGPYTRQISKKDNLFLTLIGHAPDAFGSQTTKLHLKQISSDFAERFRMWVEKTQLKGVMGKGPVPGYHPLYKPCGRVTGGTVVSAPGIFTAVRF